MQLGLSVLFATVTAAVTVSAQVYSGYVLTADPGQNLPKINSLWLTVSFYQGGLWIGDAKTDPSSEPFICKGRALLSHSLGLCNQASFLISNMLTGILL